MNGRVALAILVVLLLVGCEAAAAAGASCSRSSECAAPLTCTYGRCHVGCVDVRDCPIGARCIVNPAGAVCSISIENHCSTDVCPAPLACIDDQCRTPCASASDCLAGTCVAGNCVEPVSGADAGMSIDAAMRADAAQTVDAFVPDAFVLPDAFAPDAFAPVDAGPPCVGEGCANRIVISEVHPSGSNDGFVELYVPSAAGADVSDCIVDLANQVGAHTMVTLPSGSVVASHGFFLVGGTLVANADIHPAAMFFVSTLGGSVQLVCGTLPLDSIGWGTPPLMEGSAAPLTLAGESLERKASPSSTSTTLGPGGSEEHAGNGRDSDDNLADFVRQPSPSPQSTASAHEP